MPRSDCCKASVNSMCCISYSQLMFLFPYVSLGHERRRQEWLQSTFSCLSDYSIHFFITLSKIFLINYVSFNYTNYKDRAHECNNEDLSCHLCITFAAIYHHLCKQHIRFLIRGNQPYYEIARCKMFWVFQAATIFQIGVDTLFCRNIENFGCWGFC